MKYYAQDELDKWLIENLDLPEKGVIVDIGAGPDGINMSNSKLLEERGWTALCVDGDSRNTELLKNRPLAEMAVVSSHPTVSFFASTVSPDISGTIKQSDQVEETKDVKAVTLESLLQKHNIGKIDILSIDTEGSEIEVFESMDYKAHTPRYLIIEFDTQGKLNLEIQPYFTNLGYDLLCIHGPNMVFGYPQSIERDPHLIVYASSYDRGLEHLLNMWGDIKAAVPDARLRVFYGWDLFDRGYADNPERMAWKEKINTLMTQEGITHLGRISHGAVRKELEKAGIWAYPTHFGEISCITAMKAQAFGAVPVVVDYAALKETVQFGVKIKGDIYDQETKDLFKGALIALLHDEQHQEAVRKEMMPWAREHFAWSEVAKQWDEEFKAPRVLTLDDQVEVLLEDNQALKAWDLVKDTDWPKKDRLWLRVKHAFNEDDYKKYYSEQLVENPVPEELALDCTKLAPRFKWVVESIEKQKPRDVLDLGCADGYLSLTLAKRGFQCYGVNLYEPSVKLANQRAEKFNLSASFECHDLLAPTDRMDAVVLFEVLEHVANPQEVIDNCMQKVTDKGSFYLSTPSPEHIGITQHKAENHGTWDDGLPSGHLRIFTQEELEDLLKNYKIEQLFLDADGCWNVEVKNK